jgi:hypothetical protein
MMKKIVSLVLMLLFVNVICFAKVRNYKVEATEDIPSNKAQDEVVASLLQSLTKQAIEQSGIKLKDYNLSESEYNQFVKDVPKVEIKNKKVFMKKDNLQAVNIKLNVRMDADIAKAYLFKLKNNKTKPTAVQQEPVKPAVVEPIAVQPANINKAPDNTANKTNVEDKLKTEISSSTVKPVNSAVNSVSVVASTNTVADKTDKNEVFAEKLTIDQAIQEAQSTKQEVKALLDSFDTSLRDSNGEIARSYDLKLSKINVNVKKDQWETTKQYNEKIKKLKQEKKSLEEEKYKAINDNKIQMAKTVVPTMQFQIDKLKYLQIEKFADENANKAKIISLGNVNADEKYFTMKIFYENDLIANLKYDFSDMTVEQAKEMYKSYNKFIIEPLFSVEENDETGDVQRVLTAFGIKYPGVEKEKVVKLATIVKPFSELTRFEKYNDMLNKK